MQAIAIPQVNVDEVDFPHLAINYYEPKLYNDEDVVIPFYCSDFYLLEYCYNITRIKATLRYEVDCNVSNYLKPI